MKRLQTIAGIMIIMLTLAGLSAYNTQEKWKTYKNKDFLISYPASWTIDTSKKLGASVMLYSPLVYSNDTFKENVNVSIEEISPKVNLDSYTKSCKKELGKTVNKLVIISCNKITNEQGEFEEVIFTGEASGLKGKWIQHYRIKNSLAYVITLTTRINTYEQYKEAGLKILNSFSFKQ